MIICRPRDAIARLLFAVFFCCFFLNRKGGSSQVAVIFVSLTKENYWVTRLWFHLFCSESEMFFDPFSSAPSRVWFTPEVYFFSFFYAFSIHIRIHIENVKEGMTTAICANADWHCYNHLINVYNESHPHNLIVCTSVKFPWSLYIDHLNHVLISDYVSSNRHVSFKQ